jgi:uncharacterized protein
VLKIKPNCMCCDADIAPGDAAFICSFECTFCANCTVKLLNCPSCKGELVSRPKRTAEMLVKYPASVERAKVYEGCLQS